MRAAERQRHPLRERAAREPRRASGTSRAPATRASRASRPTSASIAARPSSSRSTRTRPPTGSTSTGWGTTAGTGARQVATVTPSAAAAAEPAGLSRRTPPRAWSIAATGRSPRPGRSRRRATSGIYFARVERLDTGGASHIVFIVRDDGGNSDLLFQTSDTTWQAYNRYGGNSLYVGSPAGPRLQGELQPAVHDPRVRARGLGVQRRIPDGPLARGQRLSTSATPPASIPIAAARRCSTTRCSCRSATTNTGRAASARTSKRRAPPACTSRSSAATRSSGRRAGRTASRRAARPTARWSATRRRTPTPRSIRCRTCGPARGATRASARRPTAGGQRTR